MTRPEFTKAMAVLTAGVNPSRPIPKETAEVWFAILSDLPLDAVMAAIQRHLAESQSEWLPPVGRIRALAIEARDGRGIDAGEAWEIVRTTANRISPYYQPQRFLDALPAIVRRAAIAFGLDRLSDGHDNAAAAHAQFRDVFASLAARDQQARLLPAALVPRVRDERPNGAGPASIGEALAGVLTQRNRVE